MVWLAFIVIQWSRGLGFDAWLVFCFAIRWAGRLGLVICDLVGGGVWESGLVSCWRFAVIW